MDHEPRHCSRDFAEDLPEDNHSGSRLVLLLLLVPLGVFGGWVAYSVAREISLALLDPISSQRIAYVAGGLAMLGVLLAIVRWQSALSPRAQAQTDEEIYEMDEHDDGDDDD